MKITILGAAGVRTPLILHAIARRQERLGIHQLALMDIDSPHLALIGGLIQPLVESGALNFELLQTTDPWQALEGADYVITTFRVGGIQSRVVDERIPLNLGLLGQETTGPGGFAMGLRTIPVLLGYIELMRQVCTGAWLVNFANPAGMLVEAVTRSHAWDRVVGICDSPGSILKFAARVLERPLEEFSSGACYQDYFGLNHLGWTRRLTWQEGDILPRLIEALRDGVTDRDIPFSPDLVEALGMIPNEYLYYYYHARQSVANILSAGESRGEQVSRLNTQLFNDLALYYNQNHRNGMRRVYHAYMNQRHNTYMAAETNRSPETGVNQSAEAGEEGYAGVALNLIEALSGGTPRTLILNLPNQGSIHAMQPEDVVEIPAHVEKDRLIPAEVGEIPDHPLGLMKQVKTYERLTIEAALSGSYNTALTALVIHPLVSDEQLARQLLDAYIQGHAGYFPTLK